MLSVPDSTCNSIIWEKRNSFKKKKRTRGSAVHNTSFGEGFMQKSDKYTTI